MSLFSKNLRFLRKNGNLRQDEISVLFNKQANTIGNWENGKSEPGLAELIRLSEYFKVSAQSFLNSDLETQSLQPGREPDPKPFESDSNRTTDALNLPLNDGSQDAFWVILREIRLVHEKVDLLLSRTESTGIQKYSDKSSH